MRQDFSLIFLTLQVDNPHYAFEKVPKSEFYKSCKKKNHTLFSNIINKCLEILQRLTSSTEGREDFSIFRRQQTRHTYVQLSEFQNSSKSAFSQLLKLSSLQDIRADRSGNKGLCSSRKGISCSKNKKGYKRNFEFNILSRLQSRFKEPIRNQGEKEEEYAILHSSSHIFVGSCTHIWKRIILILSKLCILLNGKCTTDCTPFQDTPAHIKNKLLPPICIRDKFTDRSTYTVLKFI